MGPIYEFSSEGQIARFEIVQCDRWSQQSKPRGKKLKKIVIWTSPFQDLTERTKMMDGKLFRCYYDALINNKDETEGARDSQGTKWWFTR